MIFAKLQSATEAYNTRKANMAGYGPFTETLPSQDANEKTAIEQVEKLRDLGFEPIDEAAQTIGFKVSEYEELANQNKAIIVETSSGEKMVPLWGFNDNNINPIAVELAKVYAHRSGGKDGLNFAFFASNELIALDTYCLYSEGEESKPLAMDFNKRVYQNKIQGEETFLAMRSLRYAVTMAVGPNEDYVKQAVFARAHDLLSGNDSVANLQSHISTVRKDHKFRLTNV